jgi:hypothetical protein
LSSKRTFSERFSKSINSLAPIIASCPFHHILLHSSFLAILDDLCKPVVSYYVISKITPSFSDSKHLSTLLSDSCNLLFPQRKRPHCKQFKHSMQDYCFV